MKRLCIACLLINALSTSAQEYQMITVGGTTFRSEVMEVEGKKYPVSNVWGNKMYSFPKDTLLDMAKVACTFSHTIYAPGVDERHEYYYMLLSGTKHSWYGAYQYYRVDSLLNHRDRDTISSKMHEAIMRHCAVPHNGGFEKNWKNHMTGEVETYDFFAGSGYICSEPRIDFGWTLADDTMTVCGHMCHKATCSFRGRNWVAWYADDIPISDGPWKFSGLPGLILHIEDSQREHIFDAMSVRPGNPDGRVHKEDRSEWAFKAKREWMLKAKANARRNPEAALSAAGLMPKNLDGTPATFPKPFFNPIEKE